MRAADNQASRARQLSNIGVIVHSLSTSPSASPTFVCGRAGLASNRSGSHHDSAEALTRLPCSALLSIFHRPVRAAGQKRLTGQSVLPKKRHEPQVLPCHSGFSSSFRNSLAVVRRWSTLGLLNATGLASVPVRGNRICLSKFRPMHSMRGVEVVPRPTVSSSESPYSSRPSGC